MSLATDEAAKGAMMHNGHNGDRHTSIPDPSTATVQMLLREMGGALALHNADVAAIRDLIETNKLSRTSEMGALKELLLTRVEAVERGIELAHENEARWPTVLDREVTSVKDYFAVLLATHEEMFKSVNRRFEERDVRHHDNSREQKVAIDAAFKAASDAVNIQRIAGDTAVNKSEASFTKQIENANLALITAKTEMDKRMDDSKDRINRLDQQIVGILAERLGRKELTVEKQDNTGMIVGVGGFIVALFVAIGTFLVRSNG